ncbi:MAG: hypothetical protein ACOCQD_03430 [archaeon]
MIKEEKIDEWLEIEKEKWTCEECGKQISMVLDKCHWCDTTI